MARLRRHLTYANVVSTLALVLALGGGAVYAAGRAGPKEIKRGAVRSYHVKNRQIRRQDIAGGSINSSKVSNQTLKGRDVSGDTLTGRAIEEAALGIVPLAQEARTLNGVTLRAVRVSQPEPSGVQQVIGQGGLVVTLSCDAGISTMEVAGSAAGDAGSVFNSTVGSTQVFTSGSARTVTTSNAAPGFVTVRRADGTVTRLEYELRWQPDGFGTNDVCHLHGFLLSGK